MTNWQTALTTVGLTLLALLVWELFLRGFATGLLKRDNGEPATE